LTRLLQDDFRDWQAQGLGVDWTPRSVVVFDQIGSDFLAFRRRRRPSKNLILYIDHETVFYEPLASIRLLDHLQHQFPSPKRGQTAFEAFIVSEPAADAADEPDVIVEHPKFGRGRILKRDESNKRAKWTVEFDDGQTRVLLADFLEVVTEA
jgi:hypothetical protein